ncbi:MAG: hypothetical protein RLZZ244_2327 [Verrucomicrobiota bacterium]
MSLMKRVLVFILCQIASCAVFAADSHWSFQRVENPLIPAVKNQRWPKDPLDSFILSKLEEASMVPNPDADKLQLLRRVTFDLTGLPPRIEDIKAFLNDKDHFEKAYEKVVSRLLGSPAFGERWARHWLDVARYADTDGGNRIRSFRLAWKYRNWVIEALNTDKPYDFFVAEQIAGDLFSAGKEDRTVATGFLALGAHDLSTIRLGESFDLDRIHEQIDTLSRAFLGLSVGCARCHDHKYDPIKQTDYYALAGIFLSTKVWFAAESIFDSELQDPSSKGRESLRGLFGTGEILGQSNFDAAPRIREMRLTEKVAGMLSGNGDPVRSHAFGHLERISTRPKSEQWSEVMGVSEFHASDCALRIRGERAQLGPLVPRGRILIPGMPEISPVPHGESGRRQLALWLASPENPLTARVAVNRVWEHLFGKGIVPTSTDFGFMGDKPSHPELLDHLATRFMQGRWSIKALVRGIVLSRAYRMSSQSREDARISDPANRLLWRMNWKRLEAEALRDALLQVSGILRPERPAGPPIWGTKGEAALGLSSPFRSIYLPITRDGLVPRMFDAFDFPDPSQVCARRESGSNSAQSLFFLNSTLMDQVSAKLAATVIHLGLSEGIRKAYLLTLGRDPSSDEISEATTWISHTSKYVPHRRAWDAFVQVLLSVPEFRYVR